MKNVLSLVGGTLLLSQCTQPTLTGVSVANRVNIPVEENVQPQEIYKKEESLQETVTHVETGKSSWYSVRTNRGTQTASGIPFSDEKYTVAHKTLPFGTLVRVTNLNNGKSVKGRVTDRGPFVAGRIVDLSLVMAKQIDAYHVGVAPCRLEVLSP